MTPAAFLLALTLSAANGRTEQLPRWGFQFGAGPYQPKVGSRTEHEFYKLIYVPEGGDSSLFKNHPLMWTAELEWYASTRFGLLGPLVRAGVWQAEGKTRSCSLDNSAVPCTPETVFDSTQGTTPTALNVLPVSIGAVYRMDLLDRWTPVPLVPYVKASLDYYFWSTTVRGEVTKGGHGKGGTLGAQASAGLAMNLDWLEPTAASRARGTVKLANSYIYAEASYLWANGFGNHKRLDMTDTLFQAGLALDFL